MRSFSMRERPRSASVEGEPFDGVLEELLLDAEGTDAFELEPWLEPESEPVPVNEAGGVAERALENGAAGAGWLALASDALGVDGVAPFDEFEREDCESSIQFGKSSGFEFMASVLGVEA